MPRGFTLLELLITISVLSILLATAAPSFSNINESSKMTRLADELHGFMIQAKSEAVFRNQDLWAHISMPTDPDSTGAWSISLTDSDTPGGSSILFLSGKPYKNITFAPDYTSYQIKFDGVRGKVKNGSIYFNPVGDTSSKLRVRSSYNASRVLVCGQEGEVYGYPECAP
ncbi:GspH/FimT family pseudopilin [Vibrio nereis]|uniref:GspH/FimT family pseudopilin n=1 Tax=Vibrio nereis TaxID=693 RepID=UPI0024941F27|nr:GspH/FimT family pseudopilin [Vibrio nereis]